MQQFSVRQLKVLRAIYNHPGKTALQLMDVLDGLTREDAQLLRNFENTGYVKFSRGGWYLTSKGDRALLEAS